MKQDVEVVGAADTLGDPTALGAVTGDCDFDEFRLSGRRKRFLHLGPGETHILQNEDIVEILVFKGHGNGRGKWGILRVRAGVDCRLSSPLKWRKSKASPSWEPTPADIAVSIDRIKITVAILVMMGVAWSVCGWLMGAASAPEMSSPDNAVTYGLLSGAAMLILLRGRRRLKIDRQRARILSMGSWAVSSVLHENRA